MFLRRERSVNRKLYIGAALLLIIVVIAVYTLRKEKQQEKYETAVIDRGDIIEKITATGTINPVNSVKVGSQVSGRIIKILADYNAQVKKGQVVAQLETDIYQSKVEQADANYKMSQAQAREAHAALLDTESNLRRAKMLRRDSVLSERDLEIAETKYDSAKASYGAALAREEQSKALLNTARLRPGAYNNLFAGGRHRHIAQLRCRTDRCRNISDPGSFFNSRRPHQNAVLTRMWTRRI